jgi:hypothetical protein
MTTYRVRRFNLYTLYVILSAMSLIGGLPAISDLLSALMHGTKLEWFSAVWLLFLGFLWYQVVFKPFEVTLTDDQHLNFRGLLSTKSIPIMGITSIKRVTGRYASNQFKHTQGLIVMLDPIENVEGLISKVMSVNPNIQVDGYARTG